MNSLIDSLNLWGERLLSCASSMLWQSSLLIALLFAFDLTFRRRIHAAVRHALWLVVLVKLLLPPALALPTGVAWWLPRPAPASPAKPPPAVVVTYHSSPVRRVAPGVVLPYTPPSPTLAVEAWALLAWAGVGLILLAWMGVRWGQVGRDIRQAMPAEPWLDGVLAAAQREAGLRRRVRLRVTARPMSPAVCGLFRPTVLLPCGLVAQLPPVQLRAVLLHELVHLRRGDVWVNCLQALLQIGYWWHPLVWLANARIRRAREEAVDDAVMLALRDESDHYAPTLLEVAKLAFRRPLASLGLVGILESRNALRQRIERLVNFQPPRRAGLPAAGILGIAAFAALAVPMGNAPAKADKQLNPAETTGFPVPNQQSTDYRDVCLQPEFYRGKKDRLQTLLPNSYIHPVVLAADAVAGVRSQLIELGAMASSDQVPLTFRQFSGGRFCWRIGGFTNSQVNFQVSIVEGRTNVTGAVAEWSATLQDWEPLELSVVPWEVADGLECKVEAAYFGDFQARDARRISLKIPFGEALLLAIPSRTIAEDLQLVLLQNTTEPPSTVHAQASSTLHTRTFRFDGEAFEAKVRQRAGLLAPNDARTGSQQFAEAMLAVFAELGVDLNQPPKTYFYSGLKQKVRRLLVRATEPELDAIGDFIRGRERTNAAPASARANQISGSVSSSATSTGLVTRVFKVDPNTLLTWLEERDYLSVDEVKKTTASRLPSSNNAKAATPSTTRVTNPADPVALSLQTFFSDAGVDLQPPKTFFYNDATGKLIFRATLSDLDFIQSLVEELNYAPAQINIRSKFIELPEAVYGKFCVGLLMTNGSDAVNLTGIITEEQARVLVKELEAKPDVETLMTPEVTTLSERQAQVQAVEMRTVLTGINPQALSAPGVESADGTNGLYLMQQMPFGPVLDIVPIVMPDGYSIEMSLLPTVTEFLGYDKADQDLPVYVNGEKRGATLPLPRFRVRQATTRATVWDGQTLVISVVSPVEIRTKSTGEKATEPSKDKTLKRLVVLVTPTIIDPAGNRVHPD